MKKIVALFLSLVMLFTLLSACSKKADTSAADTYLSMAQDFLDKKDVDSAIDILNKGYAETKDARLSEKLVEIYAQRDNTEATDPSLAETKATAAPATKPKATQAPTTKPAATKAPATKPAATKAPTTKATTPPTTKPAATKAPTTKATTPPTTKATTPPTTKATAPPATMHTHSYSTEVTPATCTEQGYTTYTCACGDSYVGDYTNPTHTYSKYICSKCGSVDKSHAYEYLMDWVNTNGTQDGEDAKCIIKGVNNSADRYQLICSKYSSGESYLYISHFDATTSWSSYAALTLNSYYYGFNYADDWIYGYVKPSTHTENTNLTYTNSDCSVLEPERLLPTAKAAINVMIVTLEEFLRTNGLGISIADLGFTSFLS